MSRLRQRHEIDAGKRRVLDQVVRREHHHLAYVLLHAVPARLLREKTSQAHRRNVGHDRLRINAGAAECNGVFIDVGGEHLQAGRRRKLVGVLREQHRDRIGLLARRAAGHPDADLVAGGLAFEHGRYRDSLERLERLTVAEEVRNADQHVLQQRHASRPGVSRRKSRYVGRSRSWLTCSRRSMRRSTVARLYCAKSCPVRARQQRQHIPQGGRRRVGSCRAPTGGCSSSACGSLISCALLAELHQLLRHLRDRTARNRPCPCRWRCAASRRTRLRRASARW